MQKGFSPIYFLIGTIILAILGTGYYFISKPQTNPPASPVPTSSPTPKSTTSPNPAIPTPKPTDQKVNNPNLKTFSSEKLGISFTYLQDATSQAGLGPIIAKEIGNKVCVTYDPQDNDCSKGQFVEVFTKSSNQTLEQTIKDKFLSNYSPNDCFVDTNITYPTKTQPAITSYNLAEISFPKSDDPNQSPWANADKCPAGYTSTNGISYFLMDKTHPDKYFFFSIGQYQISSENNKGWQDTLTVL